MKRWNRVRFQPNKPLYEGKPNVTASKEHLELSRAAAREGMVLLKNDKKRLPLSAGTKLALFGKGVFDYVKGGGGSGDVTVSHVHNIYDGLTSRKKTAECYAPLCDFYKDYVEKQYQNGMLPGLLEEAEISDEMIRDARAFADIALIVISRFSGEGWDRKSVYYEGQEESEKIQSKQSEEIFGESDYYLTKKEQKLIDAVTDVFADTIVVLNVGSVIDTSWFINHSKISAVLLAWQGGMEGGMAIVDLLMGDESPSGKLPDTFAADLEDYPSTAGFHESPMYVDYTEDIYVGYRYFETIPNASKKVNYPFGYGLSYSEFSIDITRIEEENQMIRMDIQIKNIGDFPAKEVVQVYGEAPQGILGKAKRVLLAFEKTKELQPEEEQMLSMDVPIAAMASYDDLGKIAMSSYVLEKGRYYFYIGNSVRDAEKLSYSWKLSDNQILCTLEKRCAPSQLKKRLHADGSYEELPLTEPHDCMENALTWDMEALKAAAPAVVGKGRILLGEGERRPQLIDVANGEITMEEFLAQLSDWELANLLGGQPNTGVANTYGWGNLEECGVPNLMTADGPAGLRIMPECEVYTTAWPIATQLASTWNRDLLYQVGFAAAEEVKENHLSIWLSPAVNIHRNPLCGRNFEYYSEDPFLAGELASALIQGVQSLKIGATVKHFCCNNKETNRRDSDSRVSERALREIYLKVFEIIIKKSSPWALMSCYNKVNGQRGSENRELLEDILRGEWGFDGVVTSDWFTFGEHYKEVLAGNDIKMGCGYPERLIEAFEKGVLTRVDMERSAKRLFELILKTD
ncbi:MAG: glycoside hydrolase family 3 C-terminal domain-containing protein [Lachnospiraceae bacterium]|nr:glycoside hydrolase family 3 C-terminal domain-containing protein [Lachnospiraceae bacterium]